MPDGGIEGNWPGPANYCYNKLWEMLTELAEKKLRIWDAHVHIFPPRLFGAIWQWFERYSISLPYRGISSAEAAGHLRGMGVDKAFLLVYAHRPDVSAGINRWLYNFCLNNPMFLPFGCIHPGDRMLNGVIEEALDVFGFCGFKIHCMVSQMKADDPSLTPVYREIERRGRMLVVHAGTAPMPAPWLGLDNIERILYAHPDMVVQVAHLGHFEIEKAARLLENYPRLFLDTAWALGNSYMKVDQRAVCDLIKAFPGRVLYGSDFPIIPEDPGMGIEKLVNLLPDSIIQDVLYCNAEKIIKGLSRPASGKLS
ncbi:MAG: hypothetical protein JL50_12800 [Peptococcaceae bacterium BICA1-7]|nr:MAG: hypothetical protein JL50_12800 [Peptococcaceae bacterium BICA1-7]HBV97278.1 hypothetical protein [Desulfotomaculum sp.]